MWDTAGLALEPVVGGPDLAFETWVLRLERLQGETRVSKAKPGPPTQYSFAPV
jgi:hypothetical protein